MRDYGRGLKMNVKELVELAKQKKYNDFCNGLEEISPRVIHYLTPLLDTDFQDDLYNNVSPGQFRKWRYALSAEAETEYLIKNNIDQYSLTEEEKKQACII